MITKLFNHAHALYQRCGEDSVPNPAICGCIDNGGTICLQQGDDAIVINKESVDELCELLKKLKRLAS